MRFLFDINHQAHVLYSKFIMKKLIANGHEVYVTARDRSLVFDLLKNENITNINRGKASNKFNRETI